MKKSKFIAIFISCFLLQYNVEASDLTSGAWKNLDENYQQIISNKNLLNGALHSRIYYTDNYIADNLKDKSNNVFLKSKLGLNLQLNDNFAIATNVKFDAVNQAIDATRQPDPASGSVFFKDEGIFVDELVLNYNYKNFSALAGKFIANFGSAWSDSNGIWVNILPKEYKQAEKLGFGIIQRAGDKKTVGEYVFGISAFTNDRKNLDNSIITSRSSKTKTDGEPGDTRSLDSYVLSTDIYYDFGNQEQLSYHFSYLNLAINDRQNHSNIPAKINDEKAFAANMNYQLPINNNFLLDTFIEYADIKNLDGDTEKNTNFLTVNFTAQLFKDFFVTLAKSKEKQKKTFQNGVDQTINEISFGYKFNSLSPILKALKLSIGYRINKIDNKINPVETRDFGFLLEHKIKF